MRLDELLSQDEWTEERLVREVRRYLPRGARKTTRSTINRLRRAPVSGGARKQTRTASVELALAIERATEGKVRAEDLPLSAGAKRMLKALRLQITAPAPVEAVALQRDGDTALVRAECFGSWSVALSELEPVGAAPLPRSEEARAEKESWRNYHRRMRERLGTTDEERAVAEEHA